MDKLENLTSLIQCRVDSMYDYFVIQARPAVGILYITKESPHFISGHCRMRGRTNGAYPYRYLDMIEELFGLENNTIECCAGRSDPPDAVTVDINPAVEPDYVDDSTRLLGIPDARYNRWRCDPPYCIDTAKEMYGTGLPNTGKLLKAGARVCKVGSLMFLLLGPVNHQPCPKGVQRIGWIPITIVPNNELRCLHIFYKYE